MRISVRALVACSLIACLACGLSGCLSGVGAAVYFLGFAPESRSDPPAAIEDLAARATQSTPDIIEIDVRLTNEDEGDLSVRIDFQELDRESLAPAGSVIAASTIPDSRIPGSVRPSQTARFLWNARDGLNDRSALVRLIVTPIEEGVEGAAETTRDPVRVGNTPVEIVDRGVDPSSAGDVIFLSFTMRDAESDPAALREITLAPSNSEPIVLDLARLTGLQRGFETSPAGRLSILRLAAAELAPSPGGPRETQDRAILDRITRPGYRDELRFQVLVSDFVDETPFANGSGRFEFFTAPPFIDLQSVQVGTTALSSGVIPIRFRGFNLNPTATSALDTMDIQVEVDLGDGRFIPAMEFPSERSSGRRGLKLLDPSEFGQPDAPYHTFLWDALSQTTGESQVDLRFRSHDQGDVPFHPIAVAPERPFAALAKTAELNIRGAPTGLTTGDFNGDGLIDVAAVSRAEGKMVWFRGSASGLQLDATLNVGEDLSSMGSGDFNGDRLSDIVVTEQARDGVIVYSGSPSGPSNRRRYTVKGGPERLVVGRFNADDFWDAAVATRESKEIVFTWGGAAGLSIGGAFQIGAAPHVLNAANLDGGESDEVVVVGANGQLQVVRGQSGVVQLVPLTNDPSFAPHSVALADFDGDGRLDVAAAGSVGVGAATEGRIWFVRGVETVGRPFEEQPTLLISPTDGEPVALIAADFDGDGIADLAAADRRRSAVVFLQGGAAGLSAPADLPIPGGVDPRAMVSGDFDGDGYVDVAVADNASANVWMAHGAPEGLVRPQAIAASDGPLAVVTGDFDNDGVLDLATANQRAETVSMLRGTRDELDRREELRTGAKPTSMAIADFNNDGFPDAAIANATDLTILSGSPGRLIRDPGIQDAVKTALAGEKRETINHIWALASGDLNGDSFVDLAIVIGSSNSKVIVLRGSPSGFVREESCGGVPCAVGKEPVAACAGDFDADGIADVLVANQTSGTVTWFRWETDHLAGGVTIDVGERPGSLATGDFNRDGTLDVLVANERSDSITVLAGGPGGPRRKSDVSLAGSPSALAVADFDGDGFLDAAVGLFDGKRTEILRGTQAGLESSNQIDTGDEPIAIATADFDGDGFPDALVVHAAEDLAVLLRGGPDGLARHGAALTGDSPVRIAIADFNADGFPDALVANSLVAVDLPPTATYLRGGREGMRRVRDIAVAAGSTAAGAGDFDGDGFIDAIILNGPPSNSATYFRQRFVTPHLSFNVGPEGLIDETGAAEEKNDPRRPPRHSIRVPAECFAEPTAVCIVPGPVFAYPQADAAARGRFLSAATDPVSLLRSGTKIAEGVPALPILTLRVREGLEELVRGSRGDLRVLRLEEAAPVATVENVPGGVQWVDDWHGGVALRFAIRRFGAYVVALERDR